MHRTIRSGALAAAALLLTLGACSGGGGDSKADIQDKIAAQLSSDGGLSAKDADCFAGVIVDEIGADKLKDVDFSASEPPPGIQDDFAAAAIKALDTCDIDPSTLGQ